MTTLARMDRMIALFPGYDLARQIATQLVADGFAADRVDVTSLQDLGRAAGMPAAEPFVKIQTYLRTLLPDLDDESIVARLAEAIRDGAATVTVHPRGTVEINRARELLQKRGPLHLFARVAPLEAQKGLFSERAAGPR